MGTLANVGPMARSVGDLAVMMNVIARPDVRDWRALPDDGADYLANLEAGVGGLKIAFSPDLGFAQVDGEISRLIAAAAQLFADLGAVVEQNDPPLGDCTEIFETHWLVGVASAFDGLPEEKLGLLDPGLDKFVLAGRSVPLMAYTAARSARIALGQAMREFHKTYDLLILPTTALPAFLSDCRSLPACFRMRSCSVPAVLSRRLQTMTSGALQSVLERHLGNRPSIAPLRAPPLPSACR